MNKKNSHFLSPTINSIKKKNILVVSEIEGGGEWIATERLLAAVHEYFPKSFRFSLVAATRNDKPALNFVYPKIFIPHSQASKPFSFIKKLLKDIFKIRGSILEISREVKPTYIIATNYLLASALLTIPSFWFKYLFYFSGFKTPKDKKFFQLDYRQAITRALEFLTLLSAKAILAPSKEGERMIKGSLGFLGNLKRYFIIPNNVPKKFFELSDFRYPKDKEKLILYVGRIAKFKGLENLIKAFALLKRKGNQLTLLIAHPSSNIDKDVLHLLKQEQTKNKLSTSIEFVPDLKPKKLAGLYRSANLFILPSETEIAPLSILEAFAAGVIVLTTNTGNSKKLFGSIDKKLILKNNRPETVASGIKYAISLRQSRIRKIGQEEMKIARNFSPMASANAFDQTLKSLSL